MRKIKEKLLLALALCLTVTSMGIVAGKSIQDVSAYENEELREATSMRVATEADLRLVLSIVDNTTIKEIVITENIELTNLLYITGKNIVIRGEEGKNIVITSSAPDFFGHIAVENVGEVTTFKDLTFDCENSYRGIDINRGTVILDNCSVKNYVSDDSGIGAVRIKYGNLIINGGSFTHNDSSNVTNPNVYPIGGGAITVLDSWGYQNEKWEWVDALGLPTHVELNNVTFKDNTSVNGGAIRFYQDKGNQMYINNCVFMNNTATKDGGAIYAGDYEDIDNSNIYINGATFSGNTAGNGGCGFNEAYSEDVKNYNSLVKNVQSLSEPFSLDSGRNYMKYAYNNYDISYKSYIPATAYYTLEYNNNFKGDDETVIGFVTSFEEAEEINLFLDIEEIDDYVAPENTFSKEGYVFLGWSEDKDATEPTYTSENSTFIMPGKDVTLYAVWKLETLNVTFKDIDGKVLNNQEINYGETAKIIDNPTKDADDKYTYTFDQWVAQGNYTLDDLDQVKEDMVFVASYKSTEIKQPNPEKPDEGDNKPTPEIPNEDNQGEVLGETQDNTNTVTKPTKDVKTDDNTNISLWVGTMVILSLVLIYMIKERKEEN